MPRKALAIGLGGTGDWVLTFLKSRLFAAYGEDATKRDVQFLLVDTIHAAARETALRSGTGKINVGYASDQHDEQVAHLGHVRVEPLEYLPMVGTIQNTAESIQKEDPHTRHFSWFPASFYLNALPPSAMDITMGAGQWRQFGRMALVMGTERGEFTGKLSRMMREANVDPNDTLMVYVVCSLGGGTGAGMFLDAAAIIRDVASQMTNLRVWIVGFLLLPGAFASVWNEMVSNIAIPRSYSAFRELIRFQTQAGQSVPFPIRYSVNDQVLVKDKLFDTVFLLDAVGELAEAKPWAGVSPCIADGLEVFTDRTQGSHILENLVNASAKLAGKVQMNQTLPAQFHSLGSHKIVLPARQYAHIFASRFVKDALNELFPVTRQPDVPVNLAKPSLAYDELALDFMKSIPNLFTGTVDYLTGRPQYLKRENFANFTMAKYRGLLSPEKEISGLNLAMLDDDPLGVKDQEQEPLPTGDVTKEEPEQAAREVVRVCNQRLEKYWSKLDGNLKKLKEGVDAEIAGRLEKQVANILNRDASVPAELRTQPVGSAEAFLNAVAAQCNVLMSEVLASTEKKVQDREHRPEEWQTRVSTAKAQMEANFSGWRSGAKAVTAQRTYISQVQQWAVSQKTARVFQTFREITEILKRQADGIRESIRGWGKIAVLEDKKSALAEADFDIASIENALKDTGRSYTSSYGLSPYSGGAVDTTMNGYRDQLYNRIAAPQVDSWIQDHKWSFDKHNLVLAAKGASATRTTVRTGEELYKWMFKQVENVILPDVIKLSIFDYFLDTNKTAEEVATFLKRYTRPLMGTLRPEAGAQESREVYLLVQKPRNPAAVEFYHELTQNVKNVYSGEHEKVQEGLTEDFDNPYSLTLLYLIQDIRSGMISKLKEYEDAYIKAISENDSHMVNHVFRCEQETARLEKLHNLASGATGESWHRISARICRMLDDPARARLFLQLLALKVIKMEEPPSQVGSSVWMILPPGNEDPSKQHVVWLTKPTSMGADPRPSRSLLFAMERFCMVGRSAKPNGEIPIPFNQLETALHQKRTELVKQGGYQALIGAYDGFLKNELPGLMEDHVRFAHMDAAAPSGDSGSSGLDMKEQEAGSLEIVARQYLEEDIRMLRANARSMGKTV